MNNTLKVVSGSTNVLLIINGKGVPAQVTKPSDRDANEHYRFLLRNDKLSVYFSYVARLEERIAELEAELEAEREESAFFESEFDRLYENIVDMEYTHVKLPVDADGVTIKLGDEVEHTQADRRFTVDSIELDRHGARVVAADGQTWAWATNCRHVNPATVESLLEEFAAKYEQVNNSPLPKIGFGNEIIGEEELPDVISEFAERIRKVVSSHERNNG